MQCHEDFAISVARIAVDDILPFRLGDSGKRRLVDRFAGVLVERRFDIEALEVAHAAAEKNPDDRFRPRSEVRAAIGRLPGIRGARDTIAKEHRAEGESGESHARIGEERAPADSGTVRDAMRGPHV